MVSPATRGRPRGKNAHNRSRSVSILRVSPKPYKMPGAQLITSASGKHPFGASKTANYRYVQSFSLTSGVTCGVQTFRLNSMFDPDLTGVGHQALFRDTMSTIYARYRVNSCAWKLTLLPRGDAHVMVGGLVTQDSGFNPATVDFATNIEKRNTTWKNYIHGNSPQCVLASNTKCHRVAGVKKQAYQDERLYSGAVGSSPSLELFLSIMMMNPLGTATTQEFMIEMEYNTTYYEPVVIGQS